jgi:deleted-in-malignant-brain-tumors protein 1
MLWSLFSKACNTGDIRLVGGANELEGRVEVCNNEQWGTICDDGWGNAEGRVACTQLGFSDRGTYYNIAEK